MISIHLAKCFRLKTEQKFTEELLPAPSFCPNYITPGWERVPSSAQEDFKGFPLSFPTLVLLWVTSNTTRSQAEAWGTGPPFPTTAGWAGKPGRILASAGLAPKQVFHRRKTKSLSTHGNCSNHWPVQPNGQGPRVLLPGKLQLQVKTEYFVLISFDPSKSFLMRKPS